MKYVLGRTTIGSAESGITKTEYDSLKNAVHNLFAQLFVEEAFDILLENYVELERDLLVGSVNEIVFRSYTYRKYHLYRHLFNRRLVNFLSAARMYIDHARRRGSDYSKHVKEEKNRIDEAFSAEYAKRFGYRLMEALRNFAQHRGLPVHAVKARMSAVDREKPHSRVRHNVRITLNTNHIKEDTCFKKAVIEEIEEKETDLMPCVREYLEGIASVHFDLRKLFQPHCIYWEDQVRTYMDRYKEDHPEEDSSSGLIAAIVDDRGLWESPVPLFMDFIEHRVFFEEKNGEFTDLTRRFVSNDPGN